MQKIKILDPQEAIKIAAGEVVERPAHILKELIENSIDAQATNITVHIKHAGKILISINDNGSGMSSEDAQLCFAHHATSKISSVQDLDSIVTYGFRGEALSSIASVAKVTIITKIDQNKSGIQLTLENGKITNNQSVAHPTGTTIKVEHLFDSIPARKKFLKSNDTEWNAIISIFQAFCLRYPNIHFKLFHEDKLSYNCPANSNTVQRCAQLWSNNLHDQLIEIHKTTKNNINVSGAISKSHYHRYNRNQIFTFVNNRWVKNIEISRAIIKGYQNVLPAQKYPAAILFINIDPTTVDINIHPKKEEIKFLHPGIVQKLIQETVNDALNNSLTETITQQEVEYSKPTTTPFQHKKIDNPFVRSHQQAVSNLFNKPTTSSDNKNNVKQVALPNKPFISQTILKQTQTNNSLPELNQTIYQQEPHTIIGQFKTTYILIEKSQELILIDQHAAHERILYENFKKKFQQIATVHLLFPHIIKLAKTDLSIIIDHSKLFKQHGIVFEQFSDTELIIQATPVSLQNKAINEIIETTLNWIKQNEFVDKQDFFKELNEQLHTQKACKTACKAGDTLNQEQMCNIVTKLLTIENRFCCPHGRPTMWSLTLKEIEKQFKRDYKSKYNTVF